MSRGPTHGTRVLDRVDVEALMRRSRTAALSAGEHWSPEGVTVASRRRLTAASVLPYVFVLLGLFAVAGLVTGLRAAVEARGDLEPMQWVRLATLGVGAAVVAGQGRVLVARTDTGRRLAAWVDRVRPETSHTHAAAPVLDAVPLGALRRRAPAGLGSVPEHARRVHAAHRTTSGATWWTLVVLSLLLSAGIIALMAVLIGRDLADGRDAGWWLLPPALALLVAAVGSALTVRTALRSRRDRRQRRSGRLFRRVVGWVTRGSPASAPAASAGGSSSGAGAGGLALGSASRSTALRQTAGRLGLAAASPSLPVLDAFSDDDASTLVATSGTGASGGLAGGTGEAPPPPGDDPASEDGPGHGAPWVPFLAAVIATFFLGWAPWHAGAEGGDPTPEPPPPEATVLIPFVTVTATPTFTVPLGPGGFTIPVTPPPELPGPGDLADPSQADAPPASPAPAFVPPSTTATPAPPTPTPTPTPSPPTVTPTTTPTPTPVVTPTVTTTPTPTPVVSPTPTDTPTETPTHTPRPPRDPDPPDPPREPECTPVPGGPPCR